MNDDRLQMETLSPTREAEDLPLEVVPDWGEQLTRANEVCRLIDRHLDYEASGRKVWKMKEFRPNDLCPEQRVQLISDLYAVAG